ncbi:MAG: hypothetical protein HFH68_13985 [Lachnospiraceae bacterium]|nr:hypothetical protein [Lachnospiraceae bacterium]
MDVGVIIGFVVWCIVGGIFLIIGGSCFFASRPVGFWANVKMCEVNNTKKYNRAMGKLFCCFGIVFIILGIPLLTGQNSPLLFLSITGTMALVITTMLVYELVIMKKYRKN